MDVWSESKQTLCVSFCGRDAREMGGVELNLRGAGGEEKGRAVIIIRVIIVINKRR